MMILVFPTMKNENLFGKRKKRKKALFSLVFEAFFEFPIQLQKKVLLVLFGISFI